MYLDAKCLKNGFSPDHEIIRAFRSPQHVGRFPAPPMEMNEGQLGPIHNPEETNRIVPQIRH